MLRSSVSDRSKSSVKIEFAKKEKKQRDFTCSSWTQKGKLKLSRRQMRRKPRRWSKIALEEKLKSLIVNSVSSLTSNSVSRGFLSKMRRV